LASVAGTKTGGKRAGNSKPVAAHPLFAAYLAFWFAALLGLSSLAVGTPNLERAVGVLQLQSLVPAAAPPLGITARALIAAAMALLGAGLGLIVARLFAPKNGAEPRTSFRWPAMAMPSFKQSQRAAPEAPVTVRARDIHPDAPVRRPIFAHEEFGDSGDSEDAEAVEDMEALRAGRMGGPETTDFDLPSFLIASSPTPEPVPHAQEPVASAKDLPRAPFDLARGEAAERIASADLSDLSPVELLERFAIALQRRQERAGVPLSDEQAARVAAIGEAALALGREALDELDGVPRAAATDKPKGIAIVPSPASAHNADETEKALRDALAALHRMAGTA
jgi:hypothetical protein